MKIYTKILLLIFVLSGLTACVMQSREQGFQSTMRAYEQILRWRNIEKVNQFRKEPLIFSNVAKERFKNIKVTGYEITNIENNTALKNIVTVKIKYYHEQYAREKSLEDKQEWHFDEASEHWYISSPLPNF
jgi:hypothetical protein